MTNTGSLLAKKLTIPVDYLFWRSHARFIVENISAAVIAINVGGFITIFNSEAETVFNKPAVKVLGKHVRDVFPDIPEHEQYILQVLKTGKEVSNKESGYCPYTNCEGLYQHNVALVKGMQGEVTGAIWMRKDLTSEHRFQKEISNAEVQAIVSQIAAGAAHEIRNPLTTAKGYIQLALQQSTDNNVIKEYLGMATEDKNIESELEEKTDSGTFVRLIGADQVEIRISGVPEAIPPRVFRLYEEVAANFDTLELQEGDQVLFSYSINSQNEDVITEIEKIVN